MFADLFWLNVNPYLGLGQTSKVEFFAEILKAVNYFRKNSILDELLSSKYAFECFVQDAPR